ncbi:glycoside hydrolase family 2 protein [Kosmotoga pacifica]|uniref:beta-mannosidase n=1 Tax=Kosmotoga pacifica TaxID=1330330 RepID=A0A0G2ZCG2_9BACT|nr:glycoside hydrolase family 2 [Kosmotoga pacifica]AKI97791.1 hypothetical protein IX53_08180 [Kosmotoga pacifica]
MKVATSLNGKWEASQDKIHWSKIKVPANWYLEGLEYAGTLIYRNNFSFEKDERKHYYLKFHGVDYRARVWLNERYLGEHEGYFQNFVFHITDYLQRENELIVEVNSPLEKPENWPEQKELIKGVLGHHDCRPGGVSERGQEHNTGGIWNSVEILSSGGMAFGTMKVSSIIGGSRATLNIESSINSHFEKPESILIRYTLSGENFDCESISSEQVIELKSGVNRVNKVLFIENPELWWTWDLGFPALYKLRIEIFHNEELLDEIQEVIGIRELKTDDKIWYLNGEKIFIRGTNIIPTQWLSGYTNEAIEKDMELLKAANVNAVRVHAHVNRKEFYDACDRYGILVWQDFPLQWQYKTSEKFYANAVKQIGEMVDQLYNHPSIALWCCHNEPEKGGYDLDRLLELEAKRHDSTRGIVPYSGVDSHPYPGWYCGDLRDFISLPGAPFVTEFGAQALPNLESMKKTFSKSALWPPKYEEWKYHNFQPDQTFNVAEILTGDNIETFITNSQEYQAKLLRFAIETYRREKFSKVNGLFQFMFVDPWPSITWSVVDYFRVPKRGYYALKEAYQPVFASVFVNREKIQKSDLKHFLFLWIKSLKIINDTLNRYEKATVELILEQTKRVIAKVRFHTTIPQNSNISPFEKSEMPKIEYYEKPTSGEAAISLKVFDESENEICRTVYRIKFI